MKTLDDEFQKMPDTKARTDSNPHCSIVGRLGKQTC